MASQNFTAPGFTHCQSDSETDPDKMSNADEDQLNVGGANMTNILLEIRKDVKSMNRKFGKEKKCKIVKGIKRDYTLLKQYTEGLREQVAELSVSTAKLKARTTEAEKTNED